MFETNPLPFDSLGAVTIGAGLTLGIVYLLSGLDDLAVDLAAWWLRLKPTTLGSADLMQLPLRPQRPIAIVIAAWDEAGVIRAMLQGNLPRIRYANHRFFVGVYPNDPDTMAEVQAVAARDGRVRMVVNPRPGPTSKGQILNHVVRAVLADRDDHGAPFAAIQIQDAEDIIHPLAPALMNRALEHQDFIQIPVFALDPSPNRLVASTYADEFAESHTKDLLVRCRLGAGLPSAGVGTCCSRRLAETVMACYGELFNPDSLTEDYELGLRAGSLGFRARFACVISPGTIGGTAEFIATRAYFPDRLSRSVRQKTRWITGISLQGWAHLGWFGGAANRWFLWRDRKAPYTNLANLLGYVWLTWLPWSMPEATGDEGLGGTGRLATNLVFAGLLGANLLLMINRLAWRMRCVHRVYRRWLLTLSAPLRVPVANLINALAACRALWGTTCAALFRTRQPWVKTSHRLPPGFGMEPTEARHEDTN